MISKKRFLSILIAIYVLFLSFVACDLFSTDNSVSDELKISTSGTEVKPGEIITVKVSTTPQGVTSDSVVWFVNDEQQDKTGLSYELSTANTEKRYEIKAQCIKGNTTLTSNVINCYGSENLKLLKAVYEYTDKWDYKPAISVSVLGKDLSFDFADGYASIPLKTKNTETTPHILYSITKSFTASSILKLKDEGLLSLADRLDKYVTGLNSIYVNNDATIEELLTHKSGISDYTSNALLFTQNPFQSSAWNPVKILDYIEVPATDRETFIYSSANYIILGLIVEKISGKALNQYIQENFIKALGLTELKLAPQDSVTYTDLSHPHAFPGTFMGLVGDGITPIDIMDVIPNAVQLLAKCSWAAGGMTGTSDIVAKWGYNLLSSNGTVSNSIRTAITDSLLGFTEIDSPSTSYGIATRKLYRNGKALIGSYGRSIGDENLMFYNADKDVCIVILTSSNIKKDGTPNIDDLMYSLYDAL